MKSRAAINMSRIRSLDPDIFARLAENNPEIASYGFNLGTNTGWFKSDALAAAQRYAESGIGLTGAEREANQFNAQQAQIGRDWQEQMYNQYYSPQAQVQQFKDAGLNPALMYDRGIGSGTMPSTSAPQSISPQRGKTDSSSAGLGLLLQVIQSIAGIRNSIVQTNSQRDVAQSEVTRNIAQAGFTDTQNRHYGDVVQSSLELNKAKVDQINSLIESESVKRELYRSDISLKEAQATLVGFQALLAQVDANNRQAIIDSTIRLQETQMALNRAQASKNYKEIEALNEQIPELKSVLRSTILDNCSNAQLAAVNTMLGSEKVRLTAKEADYYGFKTVGDFTTKFVGTVAAMFGAGKVLFGTVGKAATGPLLMLDTPVLTENYGGIPDMSKYGHQ